MEGLQRTVAAGLVGGVAGALMGATLSRGQFLHAFEAEADNLSSIWEGNQPTQTKLLK